MITHIPYCRDICYTLYDVAIASSVFIFQVTAIQTFIGQSLVILIINNITL